MGMHPVGYYDLSTAGVPVHATAFRPITPSALAANPFRVFTSLLRPELIVDERLRAEALEILDKRDIFHPTVRALVAKAEEEGGLEESDADKLVKYGLETFRWHEHALVDETTYLKLKKTHPLIADITGFQGPHINHLTPRVLDIDAAQHGMAKRGWAYYRMRLRSSSSTEFRLNRSLRARRNGSVPFCCVRPRSKRCLNRSNSRAVRWMVLTGLDSVR